MEFPRKRIIKSHTLKTRTHSKNSEVVGDFMRGLDAARFFPLARNCMEAAEIAIDMVTR
jgi:hypothetical protein